MSEEFNSPFPSSPPEGALAALFPEDDPSLGAGGVACLGRALVGASLEAYVSPSGGQDLLGELPLVLFSGAGTKPGAWPFWVLVGRASQGVDGVHYSPDVLLLVQVSRLEHVHDGHSVFPHGVGKLVDVLHHLEVAAGGVNFGNASWTQLVHETAEHLAILEDVLEGSFRLWLPEDIEDPLEGLLLHILVPLAKHLGHDLALERHLALVGGFELRRKDT